MDFLGVFEAAIREFARIISTSVALPLGDAFARSFEMLVGIVLFQQTESFVCDWGNYCTGPFGSGLCTYMPNPDTGCPGNCEPAYGWCMHPVSHCWTRPDAITCCDCWCPEDGYCYTTDQDW